MATKLFFNKMVVSEQFLLWPNGHLFLFKKLFCISHKGGSTLVLIECIICIVYMYIVHVVIEYKYLYECFERKFRY